MEVSIIIPTLNEARFLERTLAHVRQLRPRPKEVVIVDGGSTDGTIAIAEGIVAGGLATGDLLKQKGSVDLAALQSSGQSCSDESGSQPGPGGLSCAFYMGIPWCRMMRSRSSKKTLADPEVSGGGFLSLMTGPLKTRWGSISAQCPENLLRPAAVSSPSVLSAWTAAFVWRSGHVLPPSRFCCLRRLRPPNCRLWKKPTCA